MNDICRESGVNDRSADFYFTCLQVRRKITSDQAHFGDPLKRHGRMVRLVFYADPLLERGKCRICPRRMRRRMGFRERITACEAAAVDHRFPRARKFGTLKLRSNATLALSRWNLEDRRADVRRMASVAFRAISRAPRLSRSSFDRLDCSLSGDLGDKMQPMTEWEASEYARISGLQEAMAEEALSLLDLKGTIARFGCGMR